ncbi:hypothetical protein [Thiofilum flexile]|uniref:hypothetical protein n=1 Tax=Thiofilum flexile TaxID=125627 RepID=UPI00036771A3|nr:hypothetical protein [Thiofilum flexile]
MSRIVFSILIGLGLMTVNVQAAEEIIASDVLAALTADWNDDGSMDRAVLVNNRETDQADLYLYLGGEVANDFKLAILKKDIAWVGSMWGTLPSLELSGKNSLLVKSANEAIGRNRWNQTITLAYRNNNFVVAGFTYNAYDTLEPNAAGTQCDINLLTGKGKLNGKAITVKDKTPLLQDWQIEGILGACKVGED